MFMGSYETCFKDKMITTPHSSLFKKSLSVFSHASYTLLQNQSSSASIRKYIWRDARPGDRDSRKDSLSSSWRKRCQIPYRTSPILATAPLLSEQYVLACYPPDTSFSTSIVQITREDNRYSSFFQFFLFFKHFLRQHLHYLRSSFRSQALGGLKSALRRLYNRLLRGNPCTLRYFPGGF